MAWLDRCIFNATAGGLSDFAVGASVTGYLTPAQAGAIVGNPYRYAAQTVNGAGNITAWEVGSGTYTAGVLARSTIEFSSNSNSKVNFSTAPQVMITALAQDWKEKLLADRTFYVRAGGADIASHTGRANTDADAFATYNYAYDRVRQTLDFNGFQVILQGDGTTFSAGLSVGLINFFDTWIGGGWLVLDGGGGTIHTTDGTPCIAFYSPITAIEVQNVTLTTTGGLGADCLVAAAPGGIYISDGVVFGACDGNHVEVSSFQGYTGGGMITFGQGKTFTVTGSAQRFILAGAQGTITFSSATVVFANPVTFSNSFIYAFANGQIVSSGITFTNPGNVTGQRFGSYGRIDTGILGSGPAAVAALQYFPGTIEGVVAHYGSYNDFPYNAPVVVTSTPYVIPPAQTLTVVNKTVAGAQALTLPGTSYTDGNIDGLTYIIKDGKGDANTNPITITPASGTIDGQANHVINTAYGSVTLIFNTTEWHTIV